MSQVYASNADRVNDQIRSLSAKDFDSKEAMGQQLVADQKASTTEKTKEYLDKWKDVQEIGDEDLAGVLGVRGLYKTTKEAKAIYDKYKSSSEQQTKPQETTGDPEEEVAEDSHIIDAEEPGDTIRGFGISEEEAGQLFEDQPPTAPSAEPEYTRLAREADENLDDIQWFDRNVSADPSIRKSAVKLVGGEQKPVDETAEAPTTEAPAPKQDPESMEDLAGDAGKTTADDVGEAAGEALASAAGDLGVAEAATAAIPVVGEAAAVIGGLVAIGDGIYHLFHKPHHSTPKPPPPVAPIPTSQLFSSKLSAGLPSTDSGLDMPASATLF